MALSRNQSINIVYPNENPFFLVRHIKNLHSYLEWSSLRFKDELLFPTKWRDEMVFSQNQSINIMYLNKNYPFILVHHEKNLDSYHEQSLSCFKDKLWFSNKMKGKNGYFVKPKINIVYPNENYKFVYVYREKNLHSCLERSSSRFINELWFPTKQRIEMVFFTKPKH